MITFTPVQLMPPGISATMVLSGSLEGQTSMKAEWRSAFMMSGVQYVMASGEMLMLE